MDAVNVRHDWWLTSFAYLKSESRDMIIVSTDDDIKFVLCPECLVLKCSTGIIEISNNSY